MQYRGKGNYCREIYEEQPGNLRLEFKGVSHTADVFFDGEQIAHHYNAYTPFSVIAKKVEKGIHKILVRVDNTFGEHSALHIPNDYYTYGGLTRPVILESIPDVYIKNVHFTPLYSDSIWSAVVKVTLCNLADRSVEVTLNSVLKAWAGSEDVRPVGTASAWIPADSECTITMEEQFPGVKIWSNPEPNLYLLRTVLSLNGESVDDLVERVGFRTVKTAGEKILLNGQQVYLKGFN